MSGIQKSSSALSDHPGTIFCTECLAENILYDDEVHLNSYLGMYILCGVCQEAISIDVDRADNERLEPTAVETSKSSEIEAEQLTGKRRKSEFRILKESRELSVTSQEEMCSKRSKSSDAKMEISISDFKPEDGVKTSSFQDNLEVENSHFLNSEMTVENLKKLLDMIKDQPCLRCGCSDRDLLTPVEGDRNLKYCHSCDGVSGVDDSMNYFDYQGFVDNCRVTPCSCGNDDPEKFVVVRDNSRGDNGQPALAIKCMMCDPVQSESDAFCSCQNAENNNTESVCTECCRAKREPVGTADGLKCSCSAANARYDFDEYGFIQTVRCEGCGASMSTNEVIPASESPKDGSSWGRTKVTTLDLIRRGDHIAWHQRLSYWHHAIVVEVQFDQIRVIHYNGPAAHKGEIVEEWLQPDLKKEQLYRIDYDPKLKDPPEKVIERAKTRIGEHSYNLLTNNCEHFARWCVTGKHCSLQAKSFYETVVQRFVWALQGRATQGLVRLGFRSANAPGKQTVLAAAKMIDKATSSELKSAAGAVGSVPAKRLTTGLTVAYEVISATRDIKNAYQQRKEGAIDRDEFIRVTIKRTCEGVGSLAGTAITVAIPIANNMVGLTLGAVIGKGVGSLVGRNVARFVR